MPSNSQDEMKKYIIKKEKDNLSITSCDFYPNLQSMDKQNINNSKRKNKHSLRSCHNVYQMLFENKMKLGAGLISTFLLYTLFLFFVIIPFKILSPYLILSLPSVLATINISITIMYFEMNKRLNSINEKNIEIKLDRKNMGKVLGIYVTSFLIGYMLLITILI